MFSTQCLAAYKKKATVTTNRDRVGNWERGGGGGGDKERQILHRQRDDMEESWYGKWNEDYIPDFCLMIMSI